MFHVQYDVGKQHTDNKPENNNKVEEAGLNVEVINHSNEEGKS